ncbi:MAG: GNAT family N-acetyltransferase [Paenibacillaceae bacterium]
MIHKISSMVLELILNLILNQVPQFDYSADEIQEFNRMYDAAIRDNKTIDYDCEFPKYRFIQYIMSNHNLLIREAIHEEIEIVHAIMIEAFTEYIGILHPPSGALSETVESLQSKIGSKGGAIIAFKDSKAVGATIYYYQENYMYIGRVSVLPTFRGKGIGREMIYYLEQQAVKMGYAETRVE